LILGMSIEELTDVDHCKLFSEVCDWSVSG